MSGKTMLVAPIVALTLATLSGCGSSGDGGDGSDAQAPAQSLPAEDKQLERRLITDDDVRKVPDGSAQEAFLEYWTAISYEDWASAVRYFSPTLRATLDPGYLVAGLRIEGVNNVPVKPIIRGALRKRGGVTIRYLVRTHEGRLRPTSTSWRQRDGVWYLTFSSTFDDSYAAAVQQVVQAETNPNGRKPSKAAAGAGARARLAQGYTLRAPTPTPTPTRTPRPTARATPAPE